MADALGVLSAAGPATNVVDLGTAVVPTWLQHPMALAASALTTQANTHGRLVLGIGLSHQPAVEQRWHMTWRSEEHTSELQSLMRISYAVFCLKKKNKYSYTVTQLAP